MYMFDWGSVCCTKDSRAVPWKDKRVTLPLQPAHVVKQLLRSLSIKQGRKYDNPLSAREIKGFIDFHQLDMTEVLLPIEEYKTYIPSN